MRKILVAYFGDFLQYDSNSSKEFIMSLNSNKVKTIELPVGYFKKDILRPIIKEKPDKIVILGMHETRKAPVFETVAKNKKITLKNPFARFSAIIYSYFLKIFHKNLRLKNPPNPKKLIEIRIQKRAQSKLRLQTKPPKLKNIKTSIDAGNFVCNYAMWVVEEYIKEKKLNLDFYFIHLPQELSKVQEREIKKFIINYQ